MKYYQPGLDYDPSHDYHISRYDLVDKFIKLELCAEAATQRCSVKKVLLKILENSRKTLVRDSIF